MQPELPPIIPIEFPGDLFSHKNSSLGFALAVLGAFGGHFFFKHFSKMEVVGTQEIPEKLQHEQEKAVAVANEDLIEKLEQVEKTVQEKKTKIQQLEEERNRIVATADLVDELKMAEEALQEKEEKIQELTQQISLAEQRLEETQVICKAYESAFELVRELKSEPRSSLDSSEKKRVALQRAFDQMHWKARKEYAKNSSTIYPITPDTIGLVTKSLQIAFVCSMNILKEYSLTDCKWEKFKELAEPTLNRSVFVSFWRFIRLYENVTDTLETHVERNDIEPMPSYLSLYEKERKHWLILRNFFVKKAIEVLTEKKMDALKSKKISLFDLNMRVIWWEPLKCEQRKEKSSNPEKGHLCHFAYLPDHRKSALALLSFLDSKSSDPAL